MVAFPAVGYITDNARTEAEVKDAFEDWLAATKQMQGGEAISTLVIATGAVTATGGIHLIDTEAAAAADDLDTVTQTNLPDGSLLVLSCASASRAVTLKHNTGGLGKLVMIDAADIVLNDVNISVMFQRRGSQWNEIRLIAPATIGRKGTVELATTLETTAGTDTDRAVTPAGLFATGSAVQQGKHSIWIPASAILPRVTNGADQVVNETATNRRTTQELVFSDGVDEFGQFHIAMPKSWNKGTVTAQFYWRTAATTGNVVWGIQGLASSDNDTWDTAFGTAVTVTDGAGAASSMRITAETGAITIAGSPANDDLISFQVYRDGNAAGDTLANTVNLVGVKLFYTTNAKNDA